MTDEEKQAREYEAELLQNTEKPSSKAAFDKSKIKLLIGMGAIIVVMIVLSTITNALIPPENVKNAVSEESEEETIPMSGFDALLEEQQNEVADAQAETISGEKEPDDSEIDINIQEDGQAGGVVTEDGADEMQNTISYYPGQSIQSAFEEDSLVQIGNTVFKLPCKVSELEAAGVEIANIGVKEPDSSVLLKPMERSGYISIDQCKYAVKFRNKAECTYKDMYVVGIIDDGRNKDANCVYFFSGLHIGSEESLLPKTYNDMSFSDFTAINTYTYGTMDSVLGGGKYTLVQCKGGKIIEIYTYNDGESGN